MSSGFQLHTATPKIGTALLTLPTINSNWFLQFLRINTALKTFSHQYVVLICLSLPNLSPQQHLVYPIVMD